MDTFGLAMMIIDHSHMIRVILFELENGMFNAGSTIDGGNLPSDVGQQIISLYHFFDVIRGINNSVIKQIEDKEYLREFKDFMAGVNVTT